MKIVSIEQMRRIEQECARSGLTTDRLMENAGRAVAEHIKKITGAPAEQIILVLAGPGNNGGDGLVAARYLYDAGATVTVYFAAPRPPQDANLRQVQERPIDIGSPAEDPNFIRLKRIMGSATAVVDALFGTGKSRSLTGAFAEILGLVSQEKARRPSLCIIAVDVPSGLDADTGDIDPTTPCADHTITLGFPKPGLFKFPGAERVGALSIADIGIPAELAADIKLELLTESWARSTLPARPFNANKGTFGRVLVIAGSINYIGAAFLAAASVARVGAGLVTLATPRDLVPVLGAKLTEAIYLPITPSEPGIVSAGAADELLKGMGTYDVLLIGCGLTQKNEAVELTRAVLFQTEAPLPPLVIDADGLNHLASTPLWWEKMKADAVLTPHPGEMARLLETSISEVQKDRIETARQAAAKWNKTVALKGPHTVIASPDGRARVSPFANPGLASAGTGDVLAGACAGLLGQGLTLFDAASLGVYIHASAGEETRRRIGDTGMLAGDLLPELPLAIKRLKEGDRCC